MKPKSFSAFNSKMLHFSLVLLLTGLFFLTSFVNQAMAFQCPEDVTISCCMDYTNTDLTGHPADFNQGYSNFSYEDDVFLDECREGYVIRTWKGYVGTTAYYCDQVITMEYANEFGGQINWPPHWQGQCGDEIPYLEPQYDRGFCDMIAHTFSDDTLRYSGGTCLKILRKWKVVDWCKFEVNTSNPEGYWEYIQVLKLVDGKKPELDSCSDLDVPALNADCTADVILTKIATDVPCGEDFPTFNWQIEFDRNNDWSPDSTVTGSGDTMRFELQNLEPGEHKVTWKVSDRCGNVRQCMEILRVSDGKPPTPYCYLSMPLVLMPQGNMIEVPASHFMKEAKDNCTAEEDLVYSWSPDPADTVQVFDCDDTGFQFLPVYAIDEAVNSDFCFIFTRITAHGNCSGNTVNEVAGSVVTMEGQPVNDLVIGLGNDEFVVHPVDTTDAAGNYLFPYVQTLAQPQMYISERNGGYQGVTTLDLVLFMKYLLGLEEPFDVNAFEKSADVNRDGLVNVQDLMALRDIILGLHEMDLPGGDNGLQIYVEENPGEFREVDRIEDFREKLIIRVVRTGDLDRFFR